MSGKTVSRAQKRMEAAARIRKARLRIDAIDRAVVRLLAFRASVVAEISRAREAQRRDPKREREVIRNALRLNRQMARQLGVGYPDRLVADVFKVIIEAGGAVQAGGHAGRRFGQAREPSLRSVPK